MAVTPTTRALSVSLVQHHTTEGAYQAMQVLDGDGESLTISLRRTVRVPNNGIAYSLPPDLGAFPIYNVLKHIEKLPKHLVEKGGVFIPIYRSFMLSLFILNFYKCH
jgi:hypothetical protein